MKSQFKVMPLDFTNIDWDPALLREIKQTDIVIAADGKHILYVPM